MIQQFRKKPVVIEAIQFKEDANSIIQIQEFMDSHVIVSYKDNENPKLLIENQEGVTQVSIEDWVIKEADGNFYSCKADLFNKTYEKI